ncbi:hypothetical protein QJQ45_012079 [Haematococcus lacustris]|nr:hypothetical protein QJQ45_012079 [Haematococcus lacustris]
MILVPNGIVSAVYPTTNNTITQLGVDIFQGLYRVQTLQTLDAKRMIIAGPYTAPGFDTRFVTISMPLYLSNVSSNESFGIPWQPFDCPPGKCYDPVTHTKWWGSVAITLNVDACLTDANGRPTLQQFSDIGMQYRLTSPAFNNSNTSDIVAESTSIAMSRDGVCRPIHLLDDKWQLCVWKDSWQPPYVVPLLVVIVAVTLFSSVATFMVLLSRHEHRVLLYSLLPKSAIKQLHAHFDCCSRRCVCPAGTPAEAILGIMEDILLGRAPSIPKVIMIKTTVQQSLDIYNPLRFALSERIRQNANVDDEVYKAIMLYMGGGEPAVPNAIDEQQHGPVEACGPQGTSPTPSIDFSSCIGALPAAIPEEPSHPINAHEADPMSADRRRPCRVANKSRMSLTVPPTRDAKLQAAESQDETSTSAPLILLMHGQPRLDATAVSCMIKHIMSHHPREVPPPNSGAALLAGGLPPFLLDVGRTGAGRGMQWEHCPSTNAYWTKQPAAVGSAPLPKMPAPAAPMLGGDSWTARQTKTKSSGHLLLPFYYSPKTSSGTVTVQHPGGRLAATANTANDASVKEDSAEYCTLSASPDMAMPVQLPAMTQVETCLGTAEGWTFNAFHLASVTCGRPLSVLTYWLLQKSGLVHWAELDPSKLARWLCCIEDGYCTNAYHNKVHAADVVQTMHVLLTRGLGSGYADKLSMLAAYLAAACHDYQHMGRTNDWLVETEDDLALLYNDRSPMENHHLAGAFSLLKYPDLNFLGAMSKTSRQRLRKLMVELVLGTDMKQHFAIIGSFTALHRSSNAGEARNSGDKIRLLRKATTPLQLRPSRQDAESSTDLRNSMKRMDSCRSQAGLQPVSEQDKLLSLQMALKCADMGHLAASESVHLAWVSRLEGEFFAQGDAERAQGLPISPLCDRTKQGVTKSQVGFFEFVALPMFNNFTARFTGTKPLLQEGSRSLTGNAECFMGAKQFMADPPPPPAQDPPAQAPPPPPAQAQPLLAAPGPAPQPQAPPRARWLDWDTNGCLNLQRSGESRQRPLQLCNWKDLKAVPPIGKEYQQGYKRVNDRLPKGRQRLHRAAQYRRGTDGRARNNAQGLVIYTCCQPCKAFKLSVLMRCPVV